MKNLCFISLCLLLLTGCETELDKTNFFPLQEGLEWNYQITKELTGEKTSRKELSIKNLGPADLKDDYEGESVFIRHTSDGTDYYILQDDTGTYRAGKRTLIEYEPRYEEKLVRILPNSEDLEAGRNWTLQTKPYALYNTPNYATNDPKKQKLSMTFEVAAVGETVTVPAGTYENCVKVEGMAELSLYADPRLGTQTIFITQTEWYAPGIGLIKLVRDEPLDLEMFKGGQIRMELIDFNH